MNITEVLQFADQLVLAQTGKHLDDLQEAVIKGVWEGQTYSKIADDCNHSESRVRDVGYKLWQILSEQLGEDVNKSNFRATIERIRNSFNRLSKLHNSSQQVLGLINHHVSLCLNTSEQHKIDNNNP
ncbi:hypothetical protein PN492_10415 [Dolichospermum circinale CS-537/01]|uniref:vWA-MoxR associated protein N-terminal HTH domain-containing protein n=2 Tax=Dolichospermum circinale TaxID=109265 RepID=A0ABT5A4T9_9CYAN|nr:hypothetical protein [Dolichospermum circinale]MDB9486951.1 hypothetical protein [Dolichospermum circinale CS-537/01]